MGDGGVERERKSRMKREYFCFFGVKERTGWLCDTHTKPPLKYAAIWSDEIQTAPAAAAATQLNICRLKQQWNQSRMFTMIKYDEEYQHHNMKNHPVRSHEKG